LKLARNVAGLRWNRFERDLWKRTTEMRRAMLCPVVASLPFGFGLIMQRAKPLSEGECDQIKEVDGFPDWDYVPPDEPFPFEAQGVGLGSSTGRPSRCAGLLRPRLEQPERDRASKATGARRSMMAAKDQEGPGGPAWKVQKRLAGLIWKRCSRVPCHIAPPLAEARRQRLNGKLDTAREVLIAWLQFC